MKDIIKRIKNRRDVKSLDIFWYRKVIEKPLKHFRLLKKHDWPIDPQKAANIIDPKYCRFKIENLTEGVL